MTNLEVIGIIALMVIIIGGGAILYLAPIPDGNYLFTGSQ